MKVIGKLFKVGFMAIVGIGLITIFTIGAIALALGMLIF